MFDQLQQSAKSIQVGDIYYHSKKPDKSYKVLNLAITEANDEICVIYQAQFGSNLIFVRLLESWLSKVEWNGKTEKRFTLV